MAGVVRKLKNICGESGSNRRRIVSACAMIVVAVAVFFTALFAPYQHYSDRNGLHIVYIENEKSGEEEEVNPSEPRVVVNETRRVNQSLFDLFEAASALSDASVLNAASNGTITDQQKYEKAKNKLNDLSKQFNDIYNRTIIEAGEAGIKTDSEQFTELFAKNLSGMNLIMLDLLNTSYMSDNSGAYENSYAGVVVGLMSALMSVLLMAACAAAIVFAVLHMLGKTGDVNQLFLRLMLAFSAMSLLFCLFDPTIPPTAGALAPACIVVAGYYVIGLGRALISDGERAVLIKNAIVGALIPISFLCLASLPSFTLYVNGMGGRHMRYPGTVGSVRYSRISAEQALGLKIPGSPITAMYVLGTLVSVTTLVCAFKALDRLYANRRTRDGIYTTVMVGDWVLSLVLVAAVAAITNHLQKAGTLVKYVAGPCWYVILAVMLACSAFLIIYNQLCKKRGLYGGEESEEEDAPQDETEASRDESDEAPQCEEPAAADNNVSE